MEVLPPKLQCTQTYEVESTDVNSPTTTMEKSVNRKRMIETLKNCIDRLDFARGEYNEDSFALIDTQDDLRHIIEALEGSGNEQ